MERPEGVDPDKWKKFLDSYEEIKAMVVPIEFYGRVIDQTGMPVSGAKVVLRMRSEEVSMAVLWKKGLRDVKTKEFMLLSDDEGFFSLIGIRGSILHIDALEKEGYIHPKKYGSFGYGKYVGEIHHPDKNNPVIFQMRKKGETEPLIREETKVRPTTDNREFFTDLIRGTSSAELTDGSDLIIRMEAEEPGEDNRYNWSISIRAVDGGLIETDDAFIYQAPENGYQDSIELSFDKEAFRWARRVDKKVYLKSRNGQVYAGLKLRIYAYHNGTGFLRIDSIINPNGSRNLEYDPAKRIRARR